MTVPVRIVDQPRVSASPSFRDTGDAHNARVTLGSFSMEASVYVEEPAQGSLDDWEAGIVQMVSGPIDTRCYRKAATGRVFVDRLDPQPRRQFYPDRDPTMGIFYGRQSMRDLRFYSANQTLSVASTDHPGLHTDTVAPRRWTNDPDFRPLDPDTWPILVRTLHRGTFYTFVVARHKPTDRLHPLYYVRWFMGVRIRFQWHGRGIRLTPTVDQYNICRLLEHRPYRSSDFPPVVNGPCLLRLAHRMAGHRRRYWHSRLLEFADHI